MTGIEIERERERVQSSVDMYSNEDNRLEAIREETVYMRSLMRQLETPDRQ